MSDWEAQLARNYEQVLERIGNAAISAGRKSEDVKLVAVTKYVDEDMIRALYSLGCRSFGESRPQVLWDKYEALKDLSIDWHLIGHLQSNKIRRTLPKVSLVHSGDSLKILRAIDDEASRLSVTQQVLCEVNISGDDSKHGFTEQQLTDELSSIMQLKNIQVRGLMAMASRVGGVEQARRDFGLMADLRLRLKERYDGDSNEGGTCSFEELSMGMSGDFEEAIANGATLVRVGSTLYEGIQK